MFALVLIFCLIASVAAQAQIGVDNAAQVNLTALIQAVVGFLLTVVAGVATALVNKYIKDSSARDVLDKALQNSLGALQQAAQGAIAANKPTVDLPAALSSYASAVQYVIDHAGDEAKRFGLTPEDLAQKIEARLGLLNVQQNVAATAAPTAAVKRP